MPELESPTKKSEKLLDNQLQSSNRPPGFGGVIIGIGKQIYLLLLLIVFFIEVNATSYFPFFGKDVNFVLLSWMYAYYCFEYKWNFIDLNLEKRLDFFESNWAFFAGLGSPCVMAIFFSTPLLSYGVMATLFPLFVLTAIGTQVEQVINHQRKQWGGRGPAKLPAFYVADTLSIWMLQLLKEASNTSQKDD